MNSRDSLAWSPPVRLWLLASVQSAWFGLMERFPRTPALLQPWREYQQVMLRTRTTRAPPVPGSVLGHRSGTSYVNKTLIKPDRPSAILSLLFLGFCWWSSPLSVRNLGIIKPAEAVCKQESRVWSAVRTPAPGADPPHRTLLQLSWCTGEMHMEYLFGGKKMPVRCKRLASE